MDPVPVLLWGAGTHSGFGCVMGHSPRVGATLGWRTKSLRDRRRVHIATSSVRSHFKKKFLKHYRNQNPPGAIPIVNLNLET